MAETKKGPSSTASWPGGAKGGLADNTVKDPTPTPVGFTPNTLPVRKG
jgi:hypothetical protein